MTLRLTSLIALVVALIATGVMLVAKPVEHGPAASAAEVTLAQAFPGAKPKPVKATLADGTTVTPLFFVDTQRMLGTIRKPSGETQLVLRTPTGERVLRSLPNSQTPEFAGFAAFEGRVVWLELTMTTRGTTETRLWTIDSDAAAPRMVTADTGDVALFDKRDDVVIHDGLVTWLAAARTDTPQTEVRTVSINGGQVKVDTRDSAYAFAAWPWLSKVNTSGMDGPTELLNLATGERKTVAPKGSELLACSPKWCRALVIGSTASSTIIEMARPDGSERLRTAAGSVAASTVDVALLDRYEIYSYAGGKLVLFDLQTRKSVVIALGVTQVMSRAPMLWWTTGDNETTAWHLLDLRELAG
ncbi:hypothetical protein Rhe02_67870 [Rhizocola hellebori]|uniref:Uncharacterized protein n=1 Tax=Rhizocola hellebori TaxID=1392758 RepID=A0A8J3QFK2_9ACTN|nr:hypothetical protein [Rhizocola hellebori]GIH08720.1 hypothetical protein Rhe02_67870 [Rhizocola hellebori]